MKNKIQLTEMTVGHLSAKLFTGWVEPSDPHHIFGALSPVISVI